MPAKQNEPRYKVYLSSTLNDLEAERRAVTDALSDECIIKYSYRASENNLVDSCLDDVAGCDMYIGILGLRYGYVPKKNNPKGLSITELEYERAAGIPRYLFVKAEKAIAFTQTEYKTKENPPEKIEAFRERVGSGDEQTASLFQTADALSMKVVKAFNEFKDKRARSPRAIGSHKTDTVRTQPSKASVRAGYLGWLKEECEKIALLGMDSKERQNVRLAQAYVPAVTTARATEEREAERLRERQHELLLHRLGQESLYVPGAPGSGKSTFCRWLALCVARGEVPGHSFETPDDFKEKLPGSLRDRFPLLVPLRQWAGRREGLHGTGVWTRKNLEKSIASWIEATSPGGLTSEVFRHELEAGRLLLILDGVDEVPERIDDHYPRSNLLTGLADALPRWTEKGRVLLTSRPYGVESDQRQRLGLPVAELQGIPRELQALFVRRWFAAVDSPEAGKKAEGLLEHLDGRPDLDELRPNPMLLTALCVKYDEGERLPGDLFKLYATVVELVLHKRYPTVRERELASLRLAAVALAMHQGPPERERATPEAEVPFEEVDAALALLNKTDTASEQGAVSAVDRRESLLSESGLLLPRGDRRAGFYHLSFQEFLAAMRLRRTGAKVPTLLERHAATPEWRAALRFLFCAIAEQQSPEAALEDFDSLSEHLKPAALERDPNPALLLADCLEVGQARGWNLEKFRVPFRRACDHALEHVEPPARAHLWRSLGQMGHDDRKGVGLTEDGLPDIDWVEIPGGVFCYGDNGEEVELDAFEISRYPVTNVQFDVFVRDRGHQRDRRLDELPEPTRPNWTVPNHPRETVSWYEAMAFCSWLNARLRERGALADGKEIRLPREQEWERAARGTDGREYPWGWNKAARANTDERGGRIGPYYLRQTSAVGIYPAGASQSGVLDLSGNVWEWCLSRYRPKGGNRVLRGGSWINNQSFARGAYRYSDDPGYRDYDVGFRLCRSSPISGEL